MFWNIQNAANSKQKERVFVILLSVISANLMCLFLGDEQEQDVVLGSVGKKFFSLPTTEVVLKQYAVGKALQAKLADQKACLKQSVYYNNPMSIK